MAIGTIDFDEIDDWAPKLAATLSLHVPASVAPKLVSATPQYIEDALDLLFELTDREAIINATLAWISSTRLMGYHGTRLTDAELDSVRAEGLLPLKAEARRNRIIRELCPKSSRYPKSDEAVRKARLKVQSGDY